MLRGLTSVGACWHCHCHPEPPQDGEGSYICSSSDTNREFEWSTLWAKSFGALRQPQDNRATRPRSSIARRVSICDQTLKAILLCWKAYIRQAVVASAVSAECVLEDSARYNTHCHAFPTKADFRFSRGSC